MSFLFSLPDAFLLSFLSWWVSTKEVGKVDQAFCCKFQRRIWLNLIADSRFSVKAGNNLHADNRSLLFLRWLNGRGVRMANKFFLVVDRETSEEDLFLVKEILSTELSDMKVVFNLWSEDYNEEENFDYCSVGSDDNEFYRFENSKAENGFLSVINSCTSLTSLCLFGVGDKTLVKVDPSVFINLTSLELHDEFADENFYVQDNKNVSYLLTAKTMAFLSGVCHNLTYLYIGCGGYVQDEDEARDITYDSEDLAKLIRANKQLINIQLGDKEEGQIFCSSSVEALRAIAETCTELQSLIVMDSSRTDLLLLADIISRNSQLGEIRLKEPNYEIRKGFTFLCGPKQGCIPSFMHAYIPENALCRTVTVDHLGTTGSDPGACFRIVRPGAKTEKRKDAQKLHAFFSKVTDLHQITLIALSSYFSSIDYDCEWSSDVTDRDICLIAVNNPTLTDLQLNGCGSTFTSGAFHSLFLLCKELRHLELGNADHLTCSDLLVIFSVPNALHRVYITRHSTFTLECALQIVAQCPSLVELLVENCRQVPVGESRSGQCVVSSSWPPRNDYV